MARSTKTGRIATLAVSLLCSLGVANASAQAQIGGALQSLNTQTPQFITGPAVTNLNPNVLTPALQNPQPPPPVSNQNPTPNAALAAPAAAAHASSN